VKQGGFRPGSGRPKGSGGNVRIAPGSIEKEAKRVGLTPLEYMLSVMNDPDVDPIWRDRMATCAAPYVHSKADYIGKREHDEERAKVIDRGSQWEHLLRRNDDVEDRKN
jgi:hypothetical protein